MVGAAELITFLPSAFCLLASPPRGASPYLAFAYTGALPKLLLYFSGGGTLYLVVGSWILLNHAVPKMR